jgi:flagellar protein FliL
MLAVPAPTALAANLSRQKLPFRHSWQHFVNHPDVNLQEGYGAISARPGNGLRRKARMGAMWQMADDQPEMDAEAGEAAEAGNAGAPAKQKISRKTLLYIGLPVLLILGAGSFFLAGPFGLLEAGEPAARPEVTHYYDLPDLVVNLSATDQSAQFLKLKVSLEADSKESIDALQPVMPRILDTFQLYLRELRSSDLDGSAGIHRLKEELLRRVNLEIEPRKVSRVLFKEIIVQ